MITNEVIIDSIATGQNIKKLMKLHNHFWDMYID